MAPALIALGAAIAAWLLIQDWLGGGSRDKQRRAELMARVRGDGAVTTARAGQVEQKHGFLFRRARPALALRGPKKGILDRLEPVLTRAGMGATPRQFILNTLVATAVFGFVGRSIVDPIGAIVGVFLAPVGAWFMVKQKTGKRRTRINAQLNDLLQVVSGGLTAGQSFLQGLSSATKEVGEPLGGELRILLNEVELGATLEGAFERLRERIGDEDMDLVIDAVLIQRKSGGNLSEVLTNISFTIRERIRIRGEIKALTGQARMSGWVLAGLPVALAAVLTLMNPSYMAPLTETPLGRMAIGAGVGSEVMGFLVMRKIANIKV